MNILYIFGGEKAQGAEIVMERLINKNHEQVNSHLLLAPGQYANQLKNSHRNFRVGTLDYLAKLNRESGHALRYIILAIRNYLMVPIAVYRYIKQYKIQMVHANTIVPSSYLTLLVLYARVFMPSVKWVWSDHDLRYFSKLEMVLAKICAALYHRTLVVSKAVKRKYGEQNKVTVLYNGLDTNKFVTCDVLRNIFRAKHLISPEAIVIGIAGVIHESKGQLALINVFKEIAVKYKNLVLVIAGDFASQTPSYSRQVTSEIAKAENIIYAGYAKGMDEFYNGCDIIVSNSNNYRSEALGTTIYEAMACEKTVVAANTGGTPEIITDGVDGFLFTAEDELSLQRKLEFAIAGVDNLADVQKNARKKVLNCFNLEIMVKKYNEILVSLTPETETQPNWKAS